MKICKINSITILVLKTVRKVLRRLYHNLLQGLLIYLSIGWISSALKTPKITVSNFGTLSCKHNKRIPLLVCSLKEKHTAPILKPPMHNIHGELLKKYSYFMNVVVIKDLSDERWNFFKFLFTSNSDSEMRQVNIQSCSCWFQLVPPSIRSKLWMEIPPWLKLSGWVLWFPFKFYFSKLQTTGLLLSLYFSICFPKHEGIYCCLWNTFFKFSARLKGHREKLKAENSFSTVWPLKQASFGENGLWISREKVLIIH